MEKVRLYPKKIQDYRGIVPDDLFEEVLLLAKKNRGLRVLHLTGLKQKEGYSEILKSQIPYMRNLGFEAVWYVMHTTPEFLKVCAKIRKGLIGNNQIKITDSEKKYFERISAYNAELFKKIAHHFDIIYIHDVEPLAIPYYLDLEGVNIVWRCHFHLTSSNKDIFEKTKRYLGEYDAAVFSSKEFIFSDLPISRRFVIPPAIDLGSLRVKKTNPQKARKIIENLGIDFRHQLISQVSRFRPEKDHLGLVEAFLIAKKSLPDLQLVLAGYLDEKDEVEVSLFKQLLEVSKKIKGIKVLKNLTDDQINAIYTMSSVVVQKSLKEGFGLSVAEAMYLGKPVIVGEVGGMRVQVAQGKNGFLVRNNQECASKIIQILEDTPLRLQMGKFANQISKKYFLGPRLIKDELLLIGKLEKKENIGKISHMF
jgi:trehalose synthase